MLRAIDESESGWQVLLVNQYTKTFKLRGQHRRIEFGQGIAEEIVREEGLLKIVDRHASWRRGPVTKGQKRMLAKLGITSLPRTSGDASNLIAKAQARDTLDRIDRAPGIHQQATSTDEREPVLA